jgi:hypothetical protein
MFAIGAISMNDNIIDWIDNHWDVIRNSVFSFDMNKFKEHVTTELNSLGIFSLTINATLLISMVCISNLLSLKNIIIALTPLTNLINSVFSIGLICIGIFTMQHSEYTTIPTWPCILLIICGCFLFLIGIMGYYSIIILNRRYLNYYITALIFCLLLLIICVIGCYEMSYSADKIISENWIEIYNNLKNNGFQVRKSFLLTQIQINFKFAGLFSLVLVIFLLTSLGTSIHQLCSIE